MDRIEILDLEASPAREAAVGSWLAQHGRRHGPAWRFDCRPEEDGIWAGLNALIGGLLPAASTHAPDLLQRHARELCLVLPGLQLEFPESLADTVDPEERTRNYPADRAYRCLHGLIDLVAELHAVAAPGPWTIVCDHFDAANGVVQRFFTELARRRGEALDLRLLLVVGGAERGAADPAAMERRALDLEPALEEPGDYDEWLPRLIDAWERSGRPERALRWQLSAMARYNHLGLYEASLTFAPAVEQGLERLFEADARRYRIAVDALFFCYVPLGRAHAVLPVLELAVTRAEGPVDAARFHYLLAMLHARFLPTIDLAAAERHLEQALELVSDGDVEEGERHFLSVFLMNGLALVRLRQRRVEEAVELCRIGVERLNRHLGPERHRLHRSVLLFNIAQVHAQIGPYEEAIEYFTQAMAMDPNYSEYYNDRGAVFFKMGELELAEIDYQRAIELSPPYGEVWTNLGQCYRAMDRMPAAVDAYTRALDLEPDQMLALLGRAEAYWTAGQLEPAMDDYDRALALDPDQPEALANRAFLRYEVGRLHEAVADLDAALALDPGLAELYLNRSVALRDLGRAEEAARDLARYLELCPEAREEALAA